MKGKNCTTSFLPKRQKVGKVGFSEKVTYIPNKEKMCLTKRSGHTNLWGGRKE